MRFIVAVMLMSVVSTVVAWPAGASVIKRTDGNDTKSPLDLAAVTVRHVPGGSSFFVKTIAPFSAAQLDGDRGAIEVDFDVNGDRDTEYWVVVLYYKGRLRAVQGKGRSTLRLLPASRPNASSVKFNIKHSYLGYPKSYDFSALSFYVASPCSKAHPCVDAIPNRYPLIRHDLTAPTIRWGKVPLLSSNVSATLTFPVAFSVKDDTYGSGVKAWALQRRMVGTSTWVTVKTGTTLAPTVQVTGEEGASYYFRILALDRQKNKRLSPTRHASVPSDDRNAVFVYSSPPTQSSPANAFLSTTSSIANGETATWSGIPFNAFACILGGPTTGAVAQVTLTIDGVDHGITMTEDGTTPARQSSVCPGIDGVGPHTVVITVVSAEPFVFDGLMMLRFP